MLVGVAAGVALLAYRRLKQRMSDDDEPSVTAPAAAPATTTTTENVVVDATYSTDAIQAAQDE